MFTREGLFGTGCLAGSVWLTAGGVYRSRRRRDNSRCWLSSSRGAFWGFWSLTKFWFWDCWSLARSSFWSRLVARSGGGSSPVLGSGDSLGDGSDAVGSSFGEESGDSSGAGSGLVKPQSLFLSSSPSCTVADASEKESSPPSGDFTRIS